MNTLKTILLPVGIGLGLLALLGVLGSTLFLFREASAIHPILGWAVFAILLAALYLLLLAPTIRILALPKPLARPSDTQGPDWVRYVERYADRLLGNARLADWSGLGDVRAARAMGDLPGLEHSVERAIARLDKLANQAISRHAAAVFVATGASQSGRLDVGIVISTQIRMIKEIAEIYYQRPRPRELWSLYSNVGGSAFLAGEIQDSEVLAVLGAPVSAALSGFVPVSGSGPLISLLVHSLLDGSANALLTLRVGVIARKHCGLRLDEPKNLLARSASVEAATLLGGVVAAGANRIATATRRLVVKSTVSAPQTAARGAAQAGTAVVGGLAKAATRVGTKAWSLSRDAVRQVGQLGQFLEPSGTEGERVQRRPGTDTGKDAITGAVGAGTTAGVGDAAAHVGSATTGVGSAAAGGTAAVGAGSGAAGVGGGAAGAGSGAAGVGGGAAGAGSGARPAAGGNKDVATMSSSRDASVSAGSGGSPVSSALPPEARSPESEVVLRDALSFWERVAEIFAP